MLQYLIYSKIYNNTDFKKIIIFVKCIFVVRHNNKHVTEMFLVTQSCIVSMLPELFLNQLY